MLQFKGFSESRHSCRRYCRKIVGFARNRILKTELDENLAMIADSIEYLKSMGKEVFFDAEHFFDGYKNNPRYATKVVKTALAAGADTIVFFATLTVVPCPMKSAPS